jgi:PKD repeat protein
VPRVLCLIAGLLVLAVPSGAQAAAWLPPTGALNGTHASISQPRVAVDDAGNVYAAWLEGSLLVVSKRPVGGVFEQPQTIDPGGSTLEPSDLDIGVDGAGNAVLVWRVTEVSGPSGLFQALRPASASAFGQSGRLAATNSTVGPPDVAVSRAGQAVIGFKNFNSVDQITVGLGSASAGFTSGGLTIFTESSPLDPQVAIDEAGDAAAVWGATVQATAAIRGTYRPRGGAFGPNPQTIQASPNVSEPDVTVDSTGRALALWVDGLTIRASTRPAGAGQVWPAGQPVDTLTNFAATPHAAFDAADAATALWAGDRALRFAVLPGPAGTVAPANEDPGRIEVDSSAQTIAAVWEAGDPGAAKAVVRPSGGAFGAIVPLSPAGTVGNSPDVAVDPRGNAAAVWVQTSSANPPALMTAEYDASPPVLSGSQAPDTAVVGQAVAFSTTASDDWSGATISWNFGDGSAASGPSVTHTYAAAGSYAVSAIAVDGAGNLSLPFTHTVTVSADPPPIDVPTRGVDFNASSVSGTVLVSVPRNAPAGRVLARRPVARAAAAISAPAGYLPFRRLGKDDNIPVGSILDASRGISSITMASNAGGSKTQVGKFSRGVFKTKQKKGSPLTTATMLGGGNFKRQCKRPRRRATAAARRPSRRLFANVKGRFRTRGRHSTATVRGTQYLVKDTCAGTLTSVLKGSVVVRDLVKKRNRVVKAGQKYLAKPKPLRRRRR